jgi:hypothetical protein
LAGIGDNLVNGDANTEKQIGEGKDSFTVMGGNVLSQKLKDHEIFPAGSPQASSILRNLSAASQLSSGADLELSSGDVQPTSHEGSLHLGFPMGLLHEEQLFGGVITSVSDTQNTNLGDLKLTDLHPFHVRTEIVDAGKGQYAFALVGCADSCTENSEQKVLLAIPVVGVDQDKQEVMIDLAAIGDEMNLLAIMDPNGDATKLQPKSAKTVAFDYSLSTLVFDVEGHMVPVKSKTTPPPETVINTRWYLRLASTFNPGFDARAATNGVGYFLTEVSATPKIERRARPFSGGDLKDYGEVHYFIKNVPVEYQKAFQASFDDWNDKFITLTGNKIFSYEFVAAGDPKAKLLVPGDPRYNILEWDLVNQASYGGLGPSIANQYTGEIFSANVLVQGPTIVTLYTKWFQANQKAQALRLAGNDAEAELLLKNTAQELRAPLVDRVSPPLAVTLGKTLKFKVNAQFPPLRDPIMERDDFEPVPVGFTYDQYMAGYFQDMISHELGHNLGLRHNFRGSLGAADEPALGKVSVSVMEYLGRGFRHLDRIGVYDQMAIKYGYLGVTPEKTDEYCTDEDAATSDNPTKSAECSSNDATNDPYAWLESQLDHAVDLLVDKSGGKTPVWSVDDMSTELGIAIQGIGFYASSADATSDKWTNFFGKGDRPKNKDGVKAYVLSSLKARLCGPEVESEINAKASSDAKAKAMLNITALRAAAVKLITPLKVFSPSDLSCG